MLFQLIGKDKYFINGCVEKNVDKTKLTRTWSYSRSLENLNIEYAKLYCGGKSLEQVCPESLKDKWISLSSLYKCYVKAFKESKVDLSEINLFDHLPESFNKDFFSLKNEITNNVIDSIKKPDNYDYLLNLECLIKQISSRRILVNDQSIKKNLIDSDSKFKKIISRMISNTTIKYKTFNTVTGRLSTDKNSFPILTLNKDFRKYIRPTNSWFLELDFNAAEVRTFLALNNQEQPKEDIHSWHMELYNSSARDEVKRKFFAWFYSKENNLSSGIKEIDTAYDKNNVLKKFWSGTKIKNPFGREIGADEGHALSYLIQSSAWDIFSRRAIAIHKFLKEIESKSFVSMLLHDSIIIDLDEKDSKLITQLKQLFSGTDVGDFRVNSKLGSTLGTMEEV